MQRSPKHQANSIFQGLLQKLRRLLYHICRRLSRTTVSQRENNMTTRITLKEQNKLYHYVAHVTSVYDGDTITVDVDLGLGMWRHGQTIRLWKIDTPEVRGEERDEGLAVRDYLRSLILGKVILLRTILDKRGDDSTGKFGRLLGELLIEEEGGALINVNQMLLDRGYAIPFGADGSAVEPAGLPRPAGAPLPASIVCPYCGVERAVTEAAVTETAVVVMCPNCLDDPFPLPTF